MRAASFACLLSILPVAAFADTLQVLSPPSPAPYHQPGTPQLCAAINFCGQRKRLRRLQVHDGGKLRPVLPPRPNPLRRHMGLQRTSARPRPGLRQYQLRTHRAPDNDLRRALQRR